jgi:hypothetical protein
MYAGVPMALPAAVSATPLPDEGRKVGSSAPVADAPGSLDFPTVLANPQSTTNVSPYLPSMMLPGFRSRCMTPRLWA